MNTVDTFLKLEIKGANIQLWYLNIWTAREKLHTYTIRSNPNKKHQTEGGMLSR
jgi:hypothetical protein